jgi:SAM-dependent methyltransferase
VRKQAGFESGLVSTTEVRVPELEHLGYDLILEHERLPFVSYAHEWTSEMLQEAALFQLDLNLRLSRHGLWLKDCGVPANVLFRNSHPVFVDFLSLVSSEEVETQEFLQPRRAAGPLSPLWTRRSACFHEIFLRMFHPYLLHPLYMLQQGRHGETRKRLLATTLNSGPDVIQATEAFGADKIQRQHHEGALAARELALVQDRWEDYLQILREEVAALKVSLDRSDYSTYYDLKKENFSFEPSAEWLPKQRAVYEAISRFRPSTVLDIGSNTGWFSVLAAHHGAQVVAVEIDEASANLLYRRAKLENLPILPLVMDFTQLPPAIPAFAGHEKDPHVVRSKISSRSPLLLPANERLQCDMVLALAIVHHFTLGRGFSLEETVRLLASFSRQQLVLEFVAKEDPLIVNEPDFFPAFKQNPSRFEKYTKENWLKELRRYFSDIEVQPSTRGREIFVCSGRTGLGLKRSVLETQVVGSIRQ